MRLESGSRNGATEPSGDDGEAHYGQSLARPESVYEFDEDAIGAAGVNMNNVKGAGYVGRGGQPSLGNVREEEEEEEDEMDELDREQAESRASGRNKSVWDREEDARAAKAAAAAAAAAATPPRRQAPLPPAGNALTVGAGAPLSRTRNPMEGMDVPHIDHLNVLAKSKSKGGVTFGTFQNVTTGETKEKGGGGVPSSPQSPRSPRGVGDPMAQYRDGWDKKAVEGMARDKKLKERNIAQNSVDYRQGLRGVFSAAPTGRNARTGSVAPPPPGVVPPPPSMPPPQPSVSLARPGESIQSSIPDADPNRYVAQGRPETEADKATRLAKQAKESQLAFEARNGGGGGGGGVGRTPTRAPPRIPGGGLPDPSPMLSQSGYDVVSSSSSSSSYNTTPLPIRLQLHSAPIPPSPAPPSDYPTDAASIIAEAMRQHAVADSALAGEDVHDEFSSYSSLSGYAGSMGAPPAREGYGAGAGSPRLTSDVPAHLRGRTASLMPSAIPGGEFGESRRTSVVVRENHVRSLQEQHQHEDREAAQAAETDSRRQGRAGRPSPGKAIQRSRSTSPPRRHAPLPPARAAMLGPRLGNRLEPRLWNPTANAGTAGTARTAGGRRRQRTRHCRCP